MAAPRFVCTACGAAVAADVEPPYLCPHDPEHVLAPEVVPTAWPGPDEPDFLARFARLLTGGRTSAATAMVPDDLAAWVLRNVPGRRRSSGPKLLDAASAALSLGAEGGVWALDETDHPGGSVRFRAVQAVQFHRAICELDAAPAEVGPPVGPVAVEGLQTLWWELLDAVAAGDVPRPDRVLVQVGSGALAAALGRAAATARAAWQDASLPRVDLVRSRGATALDLAGVERSLVHEAEALAALTGGATIEVGDDDLREAARLAATTPSSAAGLAGALALSRGGALDEDERLAIVLAGSSGPE